MPNSEALFRLFTRTSLEKSDANPTFRNALKAMLHAELPFACPTLTHAEAALCLLGRVPFVDLEAQQPDLVEHILDIVDSPEFKQHWPAMLSRRVAFSRTLLVHIPKTGGTTLLNNIMTQTAVPVWRLDLHRGDDFGYLAASALYRAVSEQKHLILACHYPLDVIFQHYRMSAGDRLLVLYRDPIELHLSAANYIAYQCQAALARDPAAFPDRVERWKEVLEDSRLEDIGMPETLDDTAAYWRAMSEADVLSIQFRVDILTSALYVRDFRNILCRSIGLLGVTDKRRVIENFRVQGCAFIKNRDVNALLRSMFGVDRAVQENVVKAGASATDFSDDQRRLVQTLLCDEDIPLYDIIDQHMRTDVSTLRL